MPSSGESKAAKVGVGLLAAGVLRWILDFLGVFGDLRTVRDLTTAAMRVPADFALVVLQYLAIIVGCALVAPALANSFGGYFARRSEERRLRRKRRASARKLLPNLSESDLALLELLVDGPRALVAAPMSALDFTIAVELPRLDTERRIYELLPGVAKEVRAEIRKRVRRGDLSSGS